jgi:hypothetical protein
MRADYPPQANSTHRQLERSGRTIVERLGLGVIPGTGWRASDIQDIARAAEDAGFESIFCTEVNNDAIATALLMGLATRCIKVGTWVAHIYICVFLIFAPRLRSSPPMRPKAE